MWICWNAWVSRSMRESWAALHTQCTHKHLTLFCSLSISEFVISEGAWNCGRNPGSIVIIRVGHRTRAPYACRTQYIQCTWLHNKLCFKTNSKQKTLAWLKVILLLFGSKVDLANLKAKCQQSLVQFLFQYFRNTITTSHRNNFFSHKSTHHALHCWLTRFFSIEWQCRERAHQGKKSQNLSLMDKTR